MSIARVTLDKARHFLALAERLESDQRDVYVALLEAAIVFGRSVTLHLQKEFAQCEGFKDWYCDQRERLKADELCAYLLETRNVILKEGPVSVRRNISVAIGGAVEVDSAFSVVVRRGGPWYRRQPKIMWEDLRGEMQERLRPFCDRGRRHLRSLRDRVRPKPPPESPQTISGQSSDETQTFHFDDERWRHQPAPDLIRTYLDKLEPIVAEAERTYAARQLREDEE
jgi:hypothetical protein